MLVGTNPRYEAPLLNTRLRKGYVHNEANVAYVGPKLDLSYKSEHLGDNANVLSQIASGSHPISKRLENAKKPLIIVGADVLSRPDGAAIIASLQSYSLKISKVCV